MTDSSDHPYIIAYAAGSCFRNPGGPAGWGCVIADFHAEGVLRLSGDIPASDGITNIRAEMIAVVEALKAIPEGGTAVLWTNSSHIPNTVSKGHKRTRSLDLWAEIDRLAAQRYIEWRTASRNDKPRGLIEAQRLAQKETARLVKAQKEGLKYA